MKPIPSLLIALALSAMPCIAQEKLAPDEADSVRTYTPGQFMKEVAADPHDGTLVRIKFNGRSTTLSKGPGGTKIGHVESRDMNNNRDFFSEMDVQVPPAGLAWFQHVNIFNYQVYEVVSARTYTVYARVKVGSSGKAEVRLVGLEVKHDLDGDSIIWNLSSDTP
jgi:hypothetical protein